MWWASSKYLPVRGSIESREPGESKLYEGATSSEPQSQKSLACIITPWLIHLLLLLISSTLLFKAQLVQTQCQCSVDAPIAQELGKWYYTLCAQRFNLTLLTRACVAHAVAAVGSRKPLTFNGGFFSPSIYRGYPSQEIDAAWDNITLGKSLSMHHGKRVHVLIQP